MSSIWVATLENIEEWQASEAEKAIKLANLSTTLEFALGTSEEAQTSITKRKKL